MLETPTECEVKSDELSVRPNENEPNASDIAAINEMSIECDAKRQTKRKKSTTIHGITGFDETTDATNVDYTIIQNENKRQKIELVPNQPDDEETKENKTKSSNEEKLQAEKSSPPSAKQSKDTKGSNEGSKLRLKYENIHTNTVQKLNAQAEQLRMEISTLRTALANEQNAVRVLR